MLSRVLYALILLLFLSIPSLSQEIAIPFQQVPGAPYFQSPQITIDPEEYDTLILKMDSKQSGTARLLWVTNYDMKFNHPKSIWFSIKAGEHSYTFNIPSQNPNWIGWIKGFLIHPEIKPELVNIRQVKIVKGNLFTNIKSGWVEFWGPKGRLVIGSTINLIPSSAIFGRSVNVYIYWIVAIFFILFLALQLYQNKGNFSLSFKNSVRKSFILALACWILLAINSDFNFFKIFKGNFIKYFGKTIEQKRAQAYGREYYDFLLFTKNKLSREPKSFGLISSRYAPDLQARIYLVPHVLTDYKKKGVPYLLIFEPDPKQISTLKDYKPFAKLKDNAYILKRIKE